jgi:hypothetical protein
MIESFHTVDRVQFTHQLRIDPVQDYQTSGSNVSVDSRQFSENDIKPHRQSILKNPIPGRIEMTSFESIENGLDSTDINVSVFACKGRKFILRIYFSQYEMFQLTTDRIQLIL